MVPENWIADVRSRSRTKNNYGATVAVNVAKGRLTHAAPTETRWQAPDHNQL